MKLKALLTVLGLIAAPLAAAAQGYPSGPVKVIVGFGPGSSGDVVARLISEELTKSLGQPFVVDNIPGAGATIAMKALADAKPDGHTLMFASSSYSAAPFLFKQLPYDPYADFTPVVSITNVPLVVAVDSKLPINSVEDLRAYAKDNPGPMPYAFGNTVGRLLGADFMKRVELEAIPISFNSVPQASVDVIGGRIPLLFTDLGGIQPMLEAGDLRAIAVATPERAARIPDAQTYQEAGLGEFGLVAWGGLIGPAGMDPATVKLLGDAVIASFQSPVLQERFAQMGTDFLEVRGDEFKQYLDRQFELWKTMVAEAGIEAQ